MSRLKFDRHRKHEGDRTTLKCFHVTSPLGLRELLRRQVELSEKMTFVHGGRKGAKKIKQIENPSSGDKDSDCSLLKLPEWFELRNPKFHQTQHTSCMCIPFYLGNAY